MTYQAHALVDREVLPLFDRTYGPAFNEEKDGDRIRKQHEAIRDYMLVNEWKTLAEIEAALGYPQASISAQLRHLRKKRFGSHYVSKRRRHEGTWEYKVRKMIWA
jgi:hypothetical protein